MSLIGLIILTSPAAQFEDFPSDLARWYVTVPPESGSEQWLVANNDTEHQWVVTLGDAGPRVKLLGKVPESRAALPFEIKRGSYEEGLAGRQISTRVKDGWRA